MDYLVRHTRKMPGEKMVYRLNEATYSRLYIREQRRLPLDKKGKILPLFTFNIMGKYFHKFFKGILLQTFFVICKFSEANLQIS